MFGHTFGCHNQGESNFFFFSWPRLTFYQYTTRRDQTLGTSGGLCQSLCSFMQGRSLRMQLEYSENSPRPTPTSYKYMSIRSYLFDVGFLKFSNTHVLGHIIHHYWGQGNRRAVLFTVGCLDVHQLPTVPHLPPSSCDKQKFLLGKDQNGPQLRTTTVKGRSKLSLKSPPFPIGQSSPHDLGN